MSIRPASRADIEAIGQIAEAAELFPASMLPEMIEPGLGDGEDIWLVAAPSAGPIGFAFARPETLTDRVWNLLALGVHPDARGNGLGAALIRALEERLPDARMMIIETTQLPDQAAARALYLKAGFAQVAIVPDFYEDGADKVVFSKRLSGPS